ncbi:hypothetical protein J3R74_002361 [Puniceicoccus vermicola]
MARAILSDERNDESHFYGIRGEVQIGLEPLETVVRCYALLASQGTAPFRSKLVGGKGSLFRAASDAGRVRTFLKPLYSGAQSFRLRCVGSDRYSVCYSIGVVISNGAAAQDRMLSTERQW